MATDRSRSGGARYVVAGAIGLAGSGIAAGTSDRVGTVEREIFVLVNDWPDWLEAAGWPVMQAGSLAMVPLASGAAWAMTHRRGPTIGLFGAGFGTWLLAKVVKKVVPRGRPVELLTGVAVRGNWRGMGFPSGHVAVVFAMAAVADGYLPARWRWPVWVVAGLTSVMRIYTGAHLPLDIVGGAGVGLAVGGTVRMAAGSTRELR